MNQSYAIEVDAECEHPDRLVKQFYQTNGYEAVPQADDLLQLRRGKKRAGWWTSNMTELWCQVTVKQSPQSLQLSYEVDTSGQILSDEDRAFWDREVAALKSFLHEGGEPVDLRAQEATRANSVTGEHRKLGLKATAMVFLIVSILAIAADRFGYL